MNNLEKLEKIFKAMSDKNRIRILKMLQRKSLCVCEITDMLKLATSTVSKHLSILRDAGLISDWKDGKWINYKLNTESADSMVLNSLLFVSIQIEDDVIVKEDKKQADKVDRKFICCSG
jgi:ArsR family transcriptional regulator, arsenate/arsenite/antimonite-responsive transcriptional repressor